MTAVNDNPVAFLHGMQPCRPISDDFLVNTHIHIPPNFSGITDPASICRKAVAEGVRVLGVSNYYGSCGYAEFASNAVSSGIFPLLGLEIITHDDELAAAQVRVNDPNNPGRMYLCGKGLAGFPASKRAREIYGGLASADESRGREIVARLNAHAERRKVDLQLDYNEIALEYAGRYQLPRENIILQERHIAEAAVDLLDAMPPEQSVGAWIALMAGDDEAPPPVVPSTRSGRQALFRSRLLKYDKPAFVPERFAGFDEAAELVRELGGILVYPVLADGAPLPCEFEKKPETLADNLEARGIFGVEFISTRNDARLLAEFTEVLEKRGFFMTVGTEHNTTGEAPTAPTCRDGEPLPAAVLERFRRGAFILAAHQFLRAQGEPGLDVVCSSGCKQRDELVELGRRVIGCVIGHDERGL